MPCSEFIALAKDLIISAAAVTGAVVAVKGLGAWKNQLKGRSEYELARRLLVGLFKYRDAVHGIRNPVIWVYEMPTPPQDEADKMSREQIQFYGTSKAYQARWDKAQNERTQLYADLLESEALWGIDLKRLFEKIYELEHELFTNIRRYLDLINPDSTDGHKEATSKARQKNPMLFTQAAEMKRMNTGKISNGQFEISKDI